jgi:Core-2/I-Branching enzyme
MRFKPRRTTKSLLRITKADMHIAYIIIAYKNFDQVERLIKRIADAESHFVLIVDSKTPDSEFELFQRKMAEYPNLRFAPRHPIRWGQFSLTYANIIGIQELLRHKTPFDYVFSMSGQDYPLAKPAQIRRVLHAANGKSFLEHHPFPIKEWIDGGVGRIYSWNFFLPGRRVVQIPKATRAKHPIVRLGYKMLGWFIPSRGPLPGNMQPFGGSMHWTLSREAVEYVDQFIEKQPEYVHRFRLSLVSDEIFFQTILANSPLKSKLINDDQRYLRWPMPNAPSPALLTMDDLSTLADCGKLFARKFDITVDAEILDAIDAMAHHPVQNIH